MRKIYILLTMLIVNCMQGYGQHVVASAGNTFTHSSASIEFTLGEVVIASLSAHSSEVTQGFHQSKLVVSEVVSGVRDEVSGIAVSVFPNPATKQLRVEISEEIKAWAEIVNLHGKTMYRLPVSSAGQTLDVSSFGTGLYILYLKDERNQVIKALKFLKIN